MADRAATIAIIGGGAIGTSVLFHLAERHGVTDAVLFERDQLGTGTTGRSVGGVRNTFSTPTNIALGHRNIAFFRDFESMVGEPLDFRQTGYLYLFHGRSAEREWHDRAEFFAQHDVTAEVRSPERAGELFDPLDPGAFRGALFAPDCGHVDPHRLTQAFGRAARDRGATIETGTAVDEVLVDDGTVIGVDTDAGTYEVDRVLNAAGPSAGAIAAGVGVDVPLTLLLRRIMVTSPVDDADSPLVIDPERACYFKSEPNGSMLVCDTAQDRRDLTDPGAASSRDVGYDYYLATAEKVSALVPAIADLDVVNGWGGVQTHSPDGHAILGPTGVDGFDLACGLSGHGVQQSPTIGMAMADYLVEGASEVLDVERFALDRFGRDDAIAPERMA